MQSRYDFDFIVIGSGFGGSVSAHRLTEKGYKVGVIEKGKRYGQKDFPHTNWNLPKYFWFPWLKFHGFFQMSPFRHVWIVSGVGVGGGSLVYANTLLTPLESVWQDPGWAHLKDWASVMPPFYETAKRMLGVTPNQYLGTADILLRKTAETQGFEDTYYHTNVGVYFGEEGKTVPDPYFGGEGPERSGCVLCGGCMVGCRYNAKNTLDKNYLYFAEKQGARIIPETMVVDVKPLNGKTDGSDGYEVHTVSSTRWLKRKKVYRTRGVVFSAGVLGTLKLLMEAKESGSLPRLSSQLGENVRTNSESLIGVRLNDKEADVTDGIAIGSGIYIDKNTHIEAVRYPKGSDVIGMLTTVLTNGNPGISRIFTWLKVILRSPVTFLRLLNPFGFAKSTIVLLVMQNLDGRIRMRLKRSWLPPGKRLETEIVEEDIPTYIPQANAFAEKMAAQFDGTAITALPEIFFDVPTTAHILGGAIMAAKPEEGVVDSESRVYHYKNMYVCDGSVVGANLGVNPSLSITALTEHAMSHVKPASETEWEE